MPAQPPRVSVEIGSGPRVVTLKEVEEFCAAARRAGLRDDAEFDARIGERVTAPPGSRLRPDSYRFAAPLPLPDVAEEHDMRDVHCREAPDDRPIDPAARCPICSARRDPRDGRTWAIPGSPNTTTTQICDAIERGLAEDGVERIMLDRAAAATLLHGRSGA